MTHFQIYHPYRWILKPLNEIRQNLEKTQKIIKNKSENSAFLLREDWESLKEILKMGSTRNARLTWSFRGPRNIEARDPWTYPEAFLPWASGINGQSKDSELKRMKNLIKWDMMIFGIGGEWLWMMLKILFEIQKINEKRDFKVYDGSHPF